jgi:hypothetical protein
MEPKIWVPNGTQMEPKWNPSWVTQHLDKWTLMELHLGFKRTLMDFNQKWTLKFNGQNGL